MPFGGAYDKFTQPEITQVMEESKAYLAITPESGNDVEKRKQSVKDQIGILKGILTPDQYEAFKIAVMKKSTTQEMQTSVIDRISQVRINTQT